MSQPKPAPIPKEKPKARDVRILVVGGTSEEVQFIQEWSEFPDSPSFTFSHVFSVGEALEQIKADVLDLILFNSSFLAGRNFDLFFKLRAHSLSYPLVVFGKIVDETIVLKAMRGGAQDWIDIASVPAAEVELRLKRAVERQKVSAKELQSLAGELEEARIQLRSLENRDSLTGLLNRQGLQQILSGKIQLLGTQPMNLAVLLIDLDDFRRVNETWGHVSGDVVLKEVTAKLRAVLRGRGFLGRIGGNQFMVLVTGMEAENSRRLAEAVRLAISSSSISLSSGSAVTITASIGGILVSQTSPSIDELLTKTHAALIQSKNDGKNRVCFDRLEHDGGGEERYSLAHILQAMKTGERFRSVKQPIVNLRDLSEVGYEFLSRSSIEVFELPDDFFRVCQEDNMLTLVDHQCFKICIAAGRSLPQNLSRHLNLFPSTLLDIPIRHLLDVIPNGKSKSVYCIEISEQQIIGDPSYLSNAVNELKQAGIRVAIDDVGFGRSCVENLILLEPDIVKIDKRWIHGISRDSVRKRSLKRLLNMSEALGAEVIAEGIELEEDLEVLKELGVPYGQGFLLGTPS